MSYANGTTHYNLPQTTGTDKRDWSDTNQAFQDIDAALYQATQDTAQAELDIDALEARMDTAEQNIADNAGDIAGLDVRLTTVEGTITEHTAQIADVRRDTEDMICAFNEASATSTHAYAIGDYFIYNDVLYHATQTIAIGDTIVPDTNCATTNVTSELLSILNNNLHGIVLKSVTSDGVKTRGALIADLFSDIDLHNYPTARVVQNEGNARNIYTIDYIGSSDYRALAIDTHINSENKLSVVYTSIYNSTSFPNQLSQCAVTDNVTSAVNNLTNNVPTANQITYSIII